MRHGLTETTVAKIHAVLARFPAVEKAVLYGSRAKGNFKPGSDIDLTLQGAALTSDMRSAIASALDDLLLPYTIDLSLLEELNHAKLREHIERAGVLFYQRAKQGAAMKNRWQTKKLGELCEVFADGDWIESKDQSLEGIRLIQTGNVGKGVFKDRGEKARYISVATFERLRCTEVFEGDCLISRLPDPVGRSCILPDTGERMITAVDCTILRFNPKQLISTFFNFFSQSLDYLKSVEAETTGTTRNRISRSNLGQVAIPVPPLLEQHRIVGLLDEAFAGIATAKANAEKNLQNARALFESHLQEVFTKRGKGWSEKRLGDIANFRNGINYTKDSKGERIKIVGVRNFQNYFSAPLDDLDMVTIDKQLCESDTLRKDDILVVRSNGNIELIGRCILVGSTSGKTAHSGFTIRLRLSSGDVSARYLCHFLKASSTRKTLTDGGTGTNIKSLNQEMLSALIIPFPSVKEQKALVAKIEQLSEETGRLEAIYRQKLTALEELKQALLHRAFAGEL